MKALCVSILTTALSHILNRRSTKQRGGDEGSIVARGGEAEGSKSTDTVEVTVTALRTSKPFRKNLKRNTYMAVNEVSVSSKRNLSSKSSPSPFAAVRSMSSVVTPLALDHVDDVEGSAIDDFQDDTLDEQKEIKSSSCLASASRLLGKELIAALLYEDLKDREDQRKTCDRPPMNPGI